MDVRIDRPIVSSQCITVPIECIHSSMGRAELSGYLQALMQCTVHELPDIVSAINHALMQ